MGVGSGRGERQDRETGGGEDFLGGGGEFRGPVPGVAADDHQSATETAVPKPVGDARARPRDRLDVHAVGTVL